MPEKLVQIMSVNDLKPGMILGDDVFNTVGLRLLAKGTTLNERSIAKLHMYEIDYVYIVEEVSIEYARKHEPKVVKSRSIKKLNAFKAFKSSYSKGVNQLHYHIVDIGEGKNISISELFTISEDMLSMMETKSDLFAFLHNLRMVDDYTYTHSVNVSLLCNIFGQWLGLRGEDLKNITVAGLIHDIGKTKVDIEILNKPGKLNDDEFEHIKKHTVYGFRMVEKQNIDKNIKMAVLMHHEKYDGSGYPLGAKGDQINDFAKIVAISDIYDAMTSNRSYRERFCPFKVIENFERECYGKLDTKFLLSFLQNIAYNYLNCWVRLSSGEEGEIVFINTQQLSRPIVRVDNTLLDLRVEKDLFIEEII
ncbi:HD-GYP domain-containing protein [Defluviitalea saccharophila]|uniref:HD-GYP domain-containing protein n=1 Tax=Defluviitalea saccharophila TaxID=879970 RepID=A0ABZ2Y6B5_9FIRM|nr:HD-GYP domain-containing protein [Candidatus Epulonipiscium sp.]